MRHGGAACKRANQNDRICVGSQSTALSPPEYRGGHQKGGPAPEGTGRKPEYPRGVWGFCVPPWAAVGDGYLTAWHQRAARFPRTAAARLQESERSVCAQKEPADRLSLQADAKGYLPRGLLQKTAWFHAFPDGQCGLDAGTAWYDAAILWQPDGKACSGHFPCGEGAFAHHRAAGGVLPRRAPQSGTDWQQFNHHHSGKAGQDVKITASGLVRAGGNVPFKTGRFPRWADSEGDWDLGEKWESAGIFWHENHDAQPLWQHCRNWQCTNKII